MSFRRSVRAATTAVIATLAWSAQTAHADVADTIRADLLHPASAVPLQSVVVGPPAPDESEVSGATNLRVTLNPPPGAPLNSILVPPGATPWFTTSTPKQLVWDLAVLQAAKHAISQGASFGTVTIVRNSAEPDGRIIIAVPPGEVPPTPPITMSIGEVQTSIKESLPAWAAHATVTTVEDAASERVVTARVQVPREVLRFQSPDTILQALIVQQQRLASEGGRIGRVIVEVSDAVSGEPVYQAGGDSFLGFVGEWYSPLIAGWVGSASPDTDVTVEDAADQVLAGP